MIDKEMIADLVFNNPLSLLVIKDKETIDYINNLVPYSSAFEIECDMSPSYSVMNFRNIPDIMAVDNDHYEQRYRIPNGLRGIICLFNICTQLKTNSLLNPLSSIHYHVDCTDVYGTAFSELIVENQEWILKELDTWLKSPDEATNRYIGSWFRSNDLRTLEFRLGEMTFDYKIILKRIIHCNSIVRKFKVQFKGYTLTSPIFEALDPNKILAYLKTVSIDNSAEQRKLNQLKNQLVRLSQVQKETTPDLPTEEPPIIRSRTHIFKPSK